MDYRVLQLGIKFSYQTFDISIIFNKDKLID